MASYWLEWCSGMESLQRGLGDPFQSRVMGFPMSMRREDATPQIAAVDWCAWVDAETKEDAEARVLEWFPGASFMVSEEKPDEGER